MKILCIADCIDPLVYSKNAKDRFRDVELVLAAGDIPMNYLGFVASTLNRQICFVFGNHNLEYRPQFKNTRQLISREPDPYEINYFGSTCISDKVIRVKGLIIAGLGGCRCYNKGENQYNELQMLLKILRLVPRLLLNKLLYGRFLDILLTHSPPLDLGDKEDIPHRGFKVFRYFLQFFQPRYHVHGHIHLYDVNAQRVVNFKKTDIINVYGHFILETMDSPPSLHFSSKS